jgi:hypothetical protein
MRQQSRYAVAVAALALTLAGCGSGSGAGTGGEELTITSPEDGASVQVPFELTWDSSVPLGPPDSGKDHVHVYVDGKSNDYTVVGGTRFRVKGLSAGKHEVQISLQHADHTPVGPESSIEVTVAGGGGPSTPADGGGGGGYGY